MGKGMFLFTALTSSTGAKREIWFLCVAAARKVYND